MTTTAAQTGTTTAYDESQITVLEGLEAVRKRPGMYIGGTGAKGLHHLIWEVVDNAVDEAMGGHASSIEVVLTADGGVRVTDDGRGIPVGKHPQTGKSTLTTVLTVLHAGGKFGGDGYKVSGGLHGVGVSVVNALSDYLKASVYRDSKAYVQEFKLGVPVQKEPKAGRREAGAPKTGTRIEFRPSADIFETTEFDREFIIRRLRQMAYLNKGLKITLVDRRDPAEEFSETFRYDGGLLDFVADMTAANDTLTRKPVLCEGIVEVEGREVAVEVALTWTTDYSEDVRSFVNTISTGDGGTHEEGFSRALTRIMNNAARDTKILKDKDQNFKGEDIREGLHAVISVLLAEPQFEGQTKAKLGSSIARTAVEQVVAEGLAEWAEKRKPEVRAVLKKVEGARKAREAARAAREVSRKASALEGSSLPGKLADCRTKDVSRSELMLVEGDSAMGSAKRARDAEFQALLPLRGKILNTYSVAPKRMLENAECAAIITAVGAGVGSEFDIEQMRYNKIVILTDADVDGSHIRVLLLTLFWRYMRPMLEAGRVYAAQPPLYKVVAPPAKRGDPDEVYYLHSDEAKDEVVERLGATGRTPRQINRYKGLGEMPAEELANTVMDTENRVLRQISVDDAAEAAELFNIFMGSNSSARREYIAAKAGEVGQLDI